MTNMALRTSARSLAALAACLLFPLGACADRYESTDQVDRDLDAVGRAIEAEDFVTAERLLEQIKQTLEGDPHELDHPSSVTNAIRSFDSMILDARGTLDQYPFVAGTIIEAHSSASSGYFVLQDRNGEHDFLFDAGLIWRGSCPISVGSHVRVLFEDQGPDLKRAVKVECLTET
jgi:hypothetical protein